MKYRRIALYTTIDWRKTMLEKELAYYKKNRDGFLENHIGKYVLIKEDELIGVYDSQSEALGEAARLFGIDSYLIRKVAEKEEEIRIPALTLGLLRADIPSTTDG